MIDKKILEKHFSRNAVNYDTFSNVQKKMAHTLMGSIDLNLLRLSDTIHILDIGCGTGFLTRQLLDIPKGKVTAIDLSPGMIAYAKREFGDNNIEFICNDIEEAEISSKYDLIISNATFQWFNHSEKTVMRLGNMLKPGGILAFSTFGDKTFYELHQSYKIASDKLGHLSNSMPGQKFYRAIELVQLCQRNLIDTPSFHYELSMKEKFEYEFFDSVKDFLEAVKKIGANNSNSIRNTKLALTREMMKTYESLFKENDKIKATYHCVFLCIQKRERMNGVG